MLVGKLPWKQLFLINNKSWIRRLSNLVPNPIHSSNLRRKSIKNYFDELCSVRAGNTREFWKALWPMMQTKEGLLDKFIALKLILTIYIITVYISFLCRQKKIVFNLTIFWA